jgi:DNA-binding transcriptional LysR family regulator
MGFAVIFSEAPGSFLPGLIGIAAGVSILPRPTVVMESGMRTLATVPLAVSGLARPIGLIYRRGKRLTPAVARFIETLRKADELPAD